MELTFLGHACFLVEVNKAKLLFDPYISPNPLAQAIDIDALKPDYLLLSHGHYDHVADVERICNNHPATIIANFEMANWYQRKGLTRTLCINPGGKRKFGFGTVKAVHEPHASAMPDGSYAGCAMGFVVEGEGKAFYFGGDTALHQNMKQIPLFYQLDFAILPVGDVFTMGIEEALYAADYMGTEKIIGMHYDSFPSIAINHERAKQLATASGKELILMNIGQTIKF
jgi:L-ascorbate metabolism protein UlaG (beta-lactamase superfamily)